MIALPGVAIHSKIYESAASVVYRGIREQDDRPLVVKLLKQDYPSPQELTRYRQEYEITSSLNLPGVVKAYSQQDYQRTLAILLEDFGGESIERWMRQRKEEFCPMPLANFFRLAIEITEILGRIHHANIIHKDINPSNIVFNPDTGVVKIIDFGIATRFNRTNPSFKSPHVLEGTLAYLSPEQTGRMNRWLDRRTDFYSLGVTFYQLLTGQLPFPTTDILELVHCHIAKTPVPPHELNAAIPKAVSDIIMKLMAKNAEDRYQSAWGIKADLERCAQQLEQSGQIDRISLGLQDFSGQFHIPQKLYGREAQIGALLAAFDRVAVRGNEDNAQFKVEMMLVSGYSGVGKTALVQELYKPITAKHGYFIWGKFDQFERNIPYSAIVDALQKLVQQLLGEPDEQVQQWRSHLLAALGSNGQIIIDAIPEVELIIGKQPPVPSVGATEAQNRFNLTFQKFVRVFCDKEHPLVIFLDDLQWIDSATLKLIELILLDEQTQFLFLIGAYRDNEVHPTHPLVLTLLELRKQGAVLQEITLAPLALESLNQLIAETLDRNPDTVRDLDQLVLRKTEGNPFFVGEFLRMLYSENLLTFNAEHLSWQWNIAQIQARNITDNVVELLLLQLKKLPEETRQILRLAACVGSQFDLETLAIVCEKTPKAIFQNLLAAIHAGLIQPLSELDEDLLVQEYKFLHDRVQQAAYALIDESHKQVVHLQIGRNLLNKTSPEQRSERLFEIVDHLNYGIELVAEQIERNEIARLNLIAGQKAKTATAYEAALKYLKTGLKFLNTESWLSEYDLTLSLYSAAAEAAYLHGRFDEMEQFVEVVLIRAKTAIDKVQVYDSRIQKYLSQGNPKSALKIGLEALNFLEINLIETPSELDVQKGLESTAALIAGREIEDLINLPKMTAPKPLAAIYILANIVGAAFMGSPALMILIVCKMVNLSINYGNAAWSPLSYATYGLVLCGVVQDIELGYKFGKLALNLAERLNTKKGNARALMVLGAHVMHWKVHLRKTIPILVDAYQNAVEIGDFGSASYVACNACCHSFFVGESLTQLEQKTATYTKAVRQLRRENPYHWIAMLWQTILNLLGRSDNLSHLIGSVYDEEQALLHAIVVRDGTRIHYFYLYQFILCYLFGEYQQAAQAAVSARQYLEEATAMITVPIFHFYDSLVLLSLLVEASSSQKEAMLSCVSTNQEKMQKWAEHAPMNYLHKYHLVEAEKARVLGQFLEAEEFYERAISGASENEFIQEEALAYELTAKHYLARGREKIAQTYMKEAHYCYDRWGAKAKVKDLENRYPQFFSQLSKVTLTSVSTTSETSSNRSDTALDLAVIMKASQAIAREIELEHLLRFLMQILIQNAGAQTGYLILENSGEWVIEATGQLNDGDGENAYITQVLQSVPIIDRLPESIINYVIRSHETVILNNAIGEGAFINESYIQRNQTKSIFCLPLLNQAKLVGVLYLENQLAAGTFTPERSQVLNLLSTQAAIAIENAKLYSKLREGESRMKQFLEAVPVGIGVLNAAGRPYYFNQQATQLLGKGIDPSLTPDRLAEVYQTYLAGTQRKYPTEKLPIVRALSGERTRVDDVEIHQNNTTIPVEAWGTPVYDEQGNIAYAIAAFQDITERKQAEKLLADYNRTLEQQVAQRTAALRRSEAKFRNIFENSQVGIFRTRLSDGLIIDANQRFADLFGYDSPDEMIGKKQTTDCYVNSSDRHKAVELLKWNDELRNFEVQLRKRDGTLFWGLYSSRLNAADGCMEGVIADISDRKSAEEALQASETELRTLIAAIPDPLYILSAQGQIICAIAVEPDLQFHPVEEMIGKTLHQLGKEQADEFVGYIQQVLRTQQILTVEYSMFLNGRETWFSTRIAPLPHEQVIWLSRDITALKQAETASILEERNRMAREIHDTLAQAFTGILAQVGAANQVLTDDLEATGAHLDLIKELARTGLSEARRSVVALRPQLLESGSLQSALHRLVTQIRAAATDTTLYYEIEGAAYSLPAEVESNLLRMGQEALTNAIRHANADEIRVELIYDRDRVCLRVQDNGQGFGVGSIPAFEGFGLLGMSERAERIGAQLTIRSQPGEGTEMIVTVDREASQ
jgi:PAS domain S-box-containing protein